MTIKQELAAKKKVALTIERGGKEPSLAEVMIAAGYSPNTARTPSKLTGTEGWKEALEAYLPDDKLLLVHNEALNATKIVTSPTEPDTTTPDYMVRLRAVELGYKVKGRMQPEDLTVNNNQTNNLQLSDEQLKRLIG